MKKGFSSPFTAILAFLGIGAYLRFSEIGLRPFWLDEANSANFLKYSLHKLWPHLAGAESGPAFVFLAKIWSQIFGTSETAIRSFSAVLSLLCVIAIYFLGKKLFGEKIGLWAAFLLSINFFSWFYAVQVRQYSAVILVSILSAYYFHRMMLEEKFLDVAFFSFLSALGVYLHPWFFFLFGAEAVWVLAKKRRKFMKTCIAFLAIFLFSSPWLSVLASYRSGGVNDWIEKPDISALWLTVNYFIWGSGWIFLIIGLVAIFFAFFRFEKIQRGENLILRIATKEAPFPKDKNNLQFTILLFVFPLAVAWIVSQFMPIYVVGRYEAIILPFFVLLVAYLFSFIDEKYLVASAATLLVIFSFASVKNEQEKISGYKINEKVAAEKLTAELTSSDAIIFTGLSRPTFDYYLPLLSNDFKDIKEYSFPEEMESHPGWQSQRVQMEKPDSLQDQARQLAKRLNQKNQNVWIVLALGNQPAEILFDSLKNQQTCEIFLDLMDPANSPAAPMHFQQILKCSLEPATSL